MATASTRRSRRTGASSPSSPTGPNLVPGDTNGQCDVFVRDRQTGTTQRVSLGRAAAAGNQLSDRPALSADGRFVAFYSDATNLVPGDTNGASDVFVRIQSHSSWNDPADVSKASAGGWFPLRGYRRALYCTPQGIG